MNRAPTWCLPLPTAPCRKVSAAGNHAPTRTHVCYKYLQGKRTGDAGIAWSMSKFSHEQRGLGGMFAPERVACVWLPHFAVQAERVRRPELEGRPVALVSG